MKCWAWGVWALGIEKPRGGSRAPDTTRKGGALLAGGPERSGQEVAGARCKLQHGENRRAGDRPWAGQGTGARPRAGQPPGLRRRILKSAPLGIRRPEIYPLEVELSSKVKFKWSVIVQVGKTERIL